MKPLSASEIYMLDPVDLANLPDYTGPNIKPGKYPENVVIMIGNPQKGERDTLVTGREFLQKAIANSTEYVPVRVLFTSNLPPFLSFLSMFKFIRRKYKFHGTDFYHVSAKKIRQMALERGIRNKDNAYAIKNPKWWIPQKQREKKYNELVEKIRSKGYDDSQPVEVMLCRSFGVLDSLDQGHHRLTICIENDIDRITVKFRAASKPPVFLACILYLPAVMKRKFFKHKYSKP